MTHFTVVIFDSGSKVDELLAPYNENIEVAPYIARILREEDKQKFMDYYHEHNPETLRITDFEKLYSIKGFDWNRKRWVKSLLDGSWEEWTTYNPDSKWDYYSVYSHKKPTFVPYAFVTPDGIWHSQGEMGWWAMHTDAMSDAEWKFVWDKAWAEHKGRITCVDCHI